MLLCIRGTWYTRTTAISTWEYEYFSCNLCNYGFHHVFFNVRLAAVQCNIFKLHFYTDQMLWYTPWNKNALIIIFSLSHPTDSLSLIYWRKSIVYVQICAEYLYFVWRWILVETNPWWCVVYAAGIISAISLITYQTSQLSDLIKEKFSDEIGWHF